MQICIVLKNCPFPCTFNTYLIPLFSSFHSSILSRFIFSPFFPSHRLIMRLSLILLLQLNSILAHILCPSFVHTYGDTAYIKDKSFIRCTVHFSSVITFAALDYTIFKFLLPRLTHQVCKFLTYDSLKFLFKCRYVSLILCLKD